MRILHVIASLSMQHGGPPRACLDTARALQARGHAVTVFTTDIMSPGEPTPPPFRRTGNGVEIHSFPHAWPRTCSRSPAMAKALPAAVRQADIVISDSLYLWHSRTVPAICRAEGKPYVVRPHGTLDPYIRKRWRPIKLALDLWFQRRAFAHAAAIFFTTEEERHLARPTLPPVGDFVLPLGVFPEDPAPRARPKPAKRRQDLLYLGRLHEKKGLDLLLGAMAALRDRFPDLRLSIRGPDDGAEPLCRALIAQHGLHDRVSIGGFADEAEKRRLFAEADLFILPSRSENFGISVVEAMVHGLPVIVSDRVNLYRELADAGVAWICGTTVDSVAGSIADALSDPAALADRAARGRAFARDRFDWDRIAERLEAILETIVASGRLEAR